MKATELRIGNIVSVYGTNGFPDVWKEQAVNAENIKTCVSHPDWFKGIRLTKSRLIAFGFKENGFSKGYIGIRHRNGSFIIDIKNFDLVMGYDPNFHTPKITNVHQLQNLYFAITGKELKMKS